jgi:protein TonB
VQPMSTRFPDAAPPLRAGIRLVPPARRPHGLAGESGVSLVLHAGLIALLLLSVARKQMNDTPASSSVAVVFEGGPKTSTPQTEESRHSSPSSQPDIHATETAPPGGLPASRPSPAMPPPRPQAEPEARPSVAPEARPSVAPEARPSVETPALPRALSALPPRRAPTPHRTAPRRAQTAPASPFAALSAPMSLSLAGHAPPPDSRGHLKRGIDLTMAPTDQNRNVMTRYAEARHALGEDWWGEFSKFVEDHKYYPLKAAMNGEDGQSVLKLVIDRDGTVRSVKVELSSGSPELDMAWVSVFRGNKVPAFPPGTNEKQITFSASMTYILEHM